MVRKYFLLKTYVACVDLDECQWAACDSNTTCVNLHGSYVCACKAGFPHLNSTNCVPG